MQRDRVPNVTNASEDLQRRPHGSLPGLSLESFLPAMVLSVVVVRECVKGYMVNRKRLLNEPPRWSGMLKPTADYRAVVFGFAVVVFKFGRQGYRYVAPVFAWIVFMPSPQRSILSRALILALFSHIYARNPYLPYS